MNIKVKQLNSDLQKSVDENIYSIVNKVKEIFKFTFDITNQKLIHLIVIS